jgi:hypothetical protein
MFEELFDSLKGNLSGLLENDQNLSGADHSEVAQSSSESIISIITNMVKGGDMSVVKEMFSGQDTPADHPVMSNILPDLQDTLAQKFGLDSNAAAGLAQKILPAIMNMFNNKVGESGQGGFDISTIISGLQNGNTGGISDIIKQFTGGPNSENQNGGGGIMDMFKKFIG